MSGRRGDMSNKWWQQDISRTSNVYNDFEQVYVSPANTGRSTLQVEMPITVKTARKNYDVNMVGHCIFCLRRITIHNEAMHLDNNNPEWIEGLQTVPSSTGDPGSLLFTLNKMWSYLQQGGTWNWDGGSADHHSAEFTALPTICQFCSRHLGTICHLMDTLISEVNKLGCIIRNSKYGGIHSWRADLFVRGLKNSSVEYKSVVDTFKFLGIPDNGWPSTAEESVGNPANWSYSFPDSNRHSETSGVVAETEVSEVVPLIPDNISCTEPPEEKPSCSPLNYYNEGSDGDNNDDDSVQKDDSDDPDYIKEECPSSSEGEDSDSPPENSEEDARDDDDDNSASPGVSRVSSIVPIVTPEGLPTQDNASAPIHNVTYVLTKDKTSRKKMFTCIVNGCGRSFQRFSEGLKNHQLRIHNIGDHSQKFTCPICSLVVCYRNGLNNHIKQVHNRVKVPRVKVNPETGTETYTMSKDNTTGKTVYTCTIAECGKIFPSLTCGLKFHQIKEHNIGVNAPVECNICSETFPNKLSLVRHRKKKHKQQNAEWFQKIGKNQKCDLCKQLLPKRDYYKHIVSHVGEEYAIKCPNLEQCSLLFCTEEALVRHLRYGCVRRIPDGEDKYLKASTKCKICGEIFLNRFGLRCHLSRFHEKGAKDLPCPIQGCPMRFCVRQSVTHHIFLHTKTTEISKDTSQTCEICKENLMPAEMGKHLKDTHQVDDVIKCLHCAFRFATRENLLDHFHEHRFIGLFCDICEKGGVSFPNLYHLRRHYYIVHQVGSRFSCERCEKEFYSSRTLQDHLAKTHPAVAEEKDTDPSTFKVRDVPSEKKFPCDECDEAFKYKLSLTRHKIENHGGELLKCRFCDKEFSSSAKRLRHQREHREVRVGKEEFPCQVAGCGKLYFSKSQLKQHVSTVHDGIKSHVCEQCGKAYSFRNGLLQHVKSVHMDIRDHVCDICGESFTRGKVLKHHKLIHTGERPFACELCGQRFRQKVVLWRHLEGHKKKGSDFKPNGPMKQLRKRVEMKKRST